MNVVDFQILLGLNAYEYIVTFIFLLAPFILLYRYLRLSISDPCFWGVLSVFFSLNMIIYLFLVDMISEFHLFVFLLSQVLYIVGLMLFDPFAKKRINYSVVKKPREAADIGNSYFYFVLFFSLFIYFLAVFVVFAFSGIPLLMESRLDTFSGGGGFGVFSRILDVSSYLLIFSSVSLLVRKKAVGLQILILMSFVAISVLMASKSAVLLILFSYFLVLSYEGKKVRVSKRQIFLLLVFLTGFYVVVNEVDVFTAFLYMLQRGVKFADVYFMALPNNNYENLNVSSNILEALMGDFLGLTRLYSWSDFGEPLGYQIFNTVHENNTISQGPNVRLDIFAFIYGGPGYSISLSLLFGAVISYCRSRGFSLIVGESIFSRYIFGFIYIKICTVVTDPVLAFSNLNNMFFLLFILFFIAIFYFSSKKNA